MARELIERMIAPTKKQRLRLFPSHGLFVIEYLGALRWRQPPP
jgi:hypothetical protein